MSGAWGSGTWGNGSWGGGVPTDPITIVDCQPIRENVIRVEFDMVLFHTGLLEGKDSSRLEKWVVTADPSTTGISGEAARAVRVVKVELTGEDGGVAPEDYGRFASLILDRPMTPWPAVYSVAWSDIWGAESTSGTTGSATMLAAYRRIEPPTIEAPRRSRDFANPQNVRLGRGSFPDPELVLGTFGIADDGDYAMDEGEASLKKRILRRVMTRKNAFVHLPGYGVGVPEHAKKLGRGAVISSLRADAEAQIGEEPDVAATRVVIVQEPNEPGLVKFRIAVRPRFGRPFAFESPFEVAD